MMRSRNKPRRISRSLLGLAFTAVTAPAAALDLSTAFQLATEHDPSVAVIGARYAAELEAGNPLRGGLRPQVQLDASGIYSHSKVTSQFFGGFEEDYPSYGAGVSLRQPVYRYDWSARKQQADALDASARINLGDRQHQLILRVAQRYFTVLLAQETQALTETEGKAINESLQDTRKRFEVGLVPGTDLKEAQARNDLAQARLINARQSLITAQDELRESIGNPPDNLSFLAQDSQLPMLTPDDVNAWVEQVRQGNAALAAARNQVTIAESALRSAQASRMPNIDATASYRRDDSSESRIGSERDDGRVGLELSLPLYDGGINGSRIRQAAAELDGAKANLTRLSAEMERQTRQSVREFQAGHAQADALLLATRSAAAALDATRNGYTAGTRTITDVLNAESAVAQARNDLARIRYGLLLQWLSLRHLAGSLQAGDLKQIDGLLTTAVATP